MKTCLHCNTFHPDDPDRCRQCGQPLPPPDAATATIPVNESMDIAALLAQHKASTRVFSTRGELRRSISIDDLFRGKDRLVIGRGADCDVSLPHPSISRRHALLERLPDGLRLRDLGSLNGTLVDGRRLREPTVLRPHERVGIGPYLFVYANGQVQTMDASRGLRLEARRLEKVVAVGGGQTRKLLDNVNLALEPGEFVSLLGPSGSGKSTLMDCLNGRRPATGGRVLANGEDFYRHFDNFRQSLGYVPQRDIVHTGLTVARALAYTARLRLPTDTDPAELHARLEDVIRLMELGPHRDTLVSDLSGGQIKRVSLGAELLGQPALLYIDEATSGLDAGTEARMMRLFRQLADEGRSIVCITHNVDNVDLCNLVLILLRGRLVFLGPPSEGRAFFRVGRLSDVYDRLEEKAPEEWAKEFAASSLHQEFITHRMVLAPEGDPAGASARSGIYAAPALRAGSSSRPKGVHRPLLHQFFVLTARYAELMWRDRRTLRLLLLQAPIVALVLLLGFAGKPFQDSVLVPRRLSDDERASLRRLLDLWKESKTQGTDQQMTVVLEQLDPELKGLLASLGGLVNPKMLEDLLAAQGPVMPSVEIVNPRFTYMLLYILVISILWFGCNNAAKEIVKEEAIYARERAVNLGILPYLASKFVVLALVCAVQTFLMMAVIYGVLEGLQAALGWPGPATQYQLGYAEQYGVLVLTAVTGMALGLLLSACVATPDRATTLMPYVLIPQIILGGGMMPVRDGALYVVAVLASPAYWAFRAVRRGATALPADFPTRMEYNESVWLPCVALVCQTAALLLLTAWCLRRKDVRKA